MVNLLGKITGVNRRANGIWLVHQRERLGKFPVFILLSAIGWFEEQAASIATTVPIRRYFTQRPFIVLFFRLKNKAQRR